MKVRDYIPFWGFVFSSETMLRIGDGDLYGLLDSESNEVLMTSIKGNYIYTQHLFEDEKYEDFELDDSLIYALYCDDHLHFTTYINKVEPENVTIELRYLYDNYVENGGKALDWLNLMILDVGTMITNYNIEIRHTIQKNIMEWYETAVKYDKYFKDNSVDPGFFDSPKEINSLEDIFDPKYHNYIFKFLDAIRVSNPPVLNSEYKFIEGQGNKGFLGMFLRKLKEEGVIKIKLIPEHSSQISKLFGFNNRLLFSQNRNYLFLDNQVSIERKIQSIIKSI
ncbi:hypothetical protein [Sphingobacterium daejeonense]|uniref:hypothetical protein n=1 Tax=Sphingobacterium daejeonense TaxID=371142 RepID=UPI0010C4F4A1|nr:hypothetical protein [Sphingobacterium daejeonense]VTQ00281.1 Uncharacterised protein [Sphingobacterium daejeonense]